MAKKTFALSRAHLVTGARWYVDYTVLDLASGEETRRHRNILERLRADGRLGNIEGLSWYSWKDTGISAHSRRTSLLATKDQAGHTSTDMTLVYYQSEQVNLEYLGLENDLFT